MHTNEIPLVRRAATNPRLSIPTRDFDKTQTLAKKCSPSHVEAFWEQVARQSEALNATMN